MLHMLLDRLSRLIARGAPLLVIALLAARCASPAAAPPSPTPSPTPVLAPSPFPSPLPFDDPTYPVNAKVRAALLAR